MIANQPASSMGAAPLASSPLQPPSTPMSSMTSNTHVTLGNTSGSDSSQEHGVPSLFTPDSGLHADLLGSSGATKPPHGSTAPTYGTTATAPTYGDHSHNKRRVLASLDPSLGPATHPPPQASFVPKPVLERPITDPHGALETRSPEASFSVVPPAPSLLSDSPVTSSGSWAELLSGTRDSQHSTKPFLRASPPPLSAHGVSWKRHWHARNLESIALPAAIQPTQDPASPVVAGAQPVGHPLQSKLSSSPAVITAHRDSDAEVAGIVRRQAQQSPGGGNNGAIGPGNWCETG